MAYIAEQRTNSSDFHMVMQMNATAFTYIDLELGKKIVGYTGLASKRLYLYLEGVYLCNIPKKYADNYSKVFFRHYKASLMEKRKATS